MSNSIVILGGGFAGVVGDCAQPIRPIDWTVALFFRPDITKVDLAVEHDWILRDNGNSGATRLSDHSRNRFRENVA